MDGRTDKQTYLTNFADRRTVLQTYLPLEMQFYISKVLPDDNKKKKKKPSFLEWKLDCCSGGIVSFLQF